jgi:hypothetical protein
MKDPKSLPSDGTRSESVNQGDDACLTSMTAGHHTVVCENDLKCGSGHSVSTRGSDPTGGWGISTCTVEG